MRFWDSSAIVPLLIEEPTSTRCRQLLRADPAQTVWCLTRVELTSALARLGREGALTTSEIVRAERRCDGLATRWSEVDALGEVRDQAQRLLRVHALRSAEALQLGAAVVAVDHRPRGRQLVTLDDVLADAAAAEGFDVLRPD
jgi:predicted nucleic acid-binding protein